MRVYFNTPTQISLLDITSMGDSVKAGDDSKIGTFDSGLKYAIALLLRHDVGIKICTLDDNVLNTEFIFDTNNVVDEVTGKTKELIVVNVNGVEHVTGFAKKLGFNWELWMALRELWSNMLDENGDITLDTHNIKAKTFVELEFEEGSDFHSLWMNKGSYIFDENEFEQIYTISNKVKAVKSECGTLKIFKNNILVYKSDTISNFWYNITFGEIDERRILSDVSSVNTTIKSAILRTDNELFLREIISSDFTYNDNDFLAGYYNSYESTGETVFNLCHSISEEFGDVRTYTWLISLVKKRKDCKLAGRKLMKVADSLWNYSTDVTIEKPIEKSVEKTGSPILEKIKKVYSFDFEVSIIETELRGGKCIADKYNNCILVDDSFDVNIDFSEFLVEFVDLTMEGNVLKNISDMLAQKFKK